MNAPCDRDEEQARPEDESLESQANLDPVRLADQGADLAAALLVEAGSPSLTYSYFIAWTESQDPGWRSLLGQSSAVLRSLPCALVASFAMQAPDQTPGGLRVEVGVFVTEDGRFVMTAVPSPPLNVLEFDSGATSTPVPSFLSIDAIADYLARFGAHRSSGGEQI